ncbi:hypothetical protein PLANPX_4000 [Lacipirellula parvula]|uniref:Uncharacterized protein n=1 Tax=Lacipirellula parvula TaxID=2650471 RepID=A0A5K7XD46_9BACT|nr:hypothetical protein PLANPX_4000 [Lacipirellula parvula]
MNRYRGRERFAIVSSRGLAPHTVWKRADFSLKTRLFATKCEDENLVTARREKVWLFRADPPAIGKLRRSDQP